MALLCAAACSLSAPSGTLFQTTEKPVGGASEPDRLKESSLPFSASNGRADTTITLDPDSKYQSIAGFGGAFTDAVASVFFQLNASLQAEVVDALWGGSGQRYNLARLTIGSTDFATTVFNYNEPDGVPLPQPDYNQSSFSIAHDQQQILPMILRAQSADELEEAVSEWTEVRPATAATAGFALMGKSRLREPF